MNCYILIDVYDTINNYWGKFIEYVWKCFHAKILLFFINILNNFLWLERLRTKFKRKFKSIFKERHVTLVHLMLTRHVFQNKWLTSLIIIYWKRETKKEYTGNRVVIFRRCKENAISFKNLPAKRLNDGRICSINLQIGIQHRQWGDIQIFNLQSVDGFLRYLRCCAILMNSHMKNIGKNSEQFNPITLKEG